MCVFVSVIFPSVNWSHSFIFCCFIFSKRKSASLHEIWSMSRRTWFDIFLYTKMHVQINDSKSTTFCPRFSNDSNCFKQPPNLLQSSSICLHSYCLKWKTENKKYDYLFDLLLFLFFFSKTEAKIKSSK